VQFLPGICLYFIIRHPWRIKQKTKGENMAERYTDPSSNIEIWALNTPMESNLFRYKITGGMKPLKSSAFIENKKIAIRICEDPPCHEQLLIPRNTFGKELIIEVQDSMGHIFSIKFAIGGKNKGSEGQVMASI
jgi:hypothetical protein